MLVEGRAHVDCGVDQCASDDSPSLATLAELRVTDRRSGARSIQPAHGRYGRKPSEDGIERGEARAALALDQPLHRGRFPLLPWDLSSTST